MGSICFYEPSEELQERYDLAAERIREIPGEHCLPERFWLYFTEVSDFVGQVQEIYERQRSGQLERRTEEEGKRDNEAFYGRLAPGTYEKGMLNPAHAVETLGEEVGGMLSFLYSDMLSMISAAFEGRQDLLTIWSELFLQVYGCFTEELEGADSRWEFTPEQLHNISRNVKDAVYWFYHDYCEIFAAEPVMTMVDPGYDFFTSIVMDSDLSDNRYLYRYGSFIGENELRMADFLRGLPEEKIAAMARTFTEGYRIGFAVTRKDITKKKTVKIEFPIGFERVVREAVKQFADMGLSVVISRESVTSFAGRGNGKRGCYSTSPNRQFDYDHKDDRAYYFDKSFVERRLEVLRDTFEKHREQAAVYGGPAVIEVFGETPFEPENKPEKKNYSQKQNELNVYHASRSGEITNTYVPGDSYSFTIIAFPLPSIGPDFEEIFARTVEVNTLDYTLYQRMQQKIIDVLDQGTHVHVTGRGDNHTDITVALHPLRDPAKETNFENCVADVNIPVGEVFTSPLLEGTSGVLHVTKVYLGELCYRDLELVFEDGMVTSCTCGNFATEEENRNYVTDNVLYHHKTLPMGEFAIGTNTTAYRMARDFGIADKLPILIAEKTGPHFAVGDTCYSHSEDVPMYNPDGKEVIARENRFSLMRKEDPSKAYFNCHTDITIPYNELKDITVVCEDGRQIPVIRDGKFVVPGTEELNLPLE